MNQLSIPVANAAALVAAGYTTIEVWSSPRLPAPLDFQEITSSVAEPATLTSAPAQTLFNAGGFGLSISVNGGAPQTITFGSSLQFWTPTQIANAINLVISGLASVVGNTVVLTSSTTGRGSTLQITASTVLDLGWTAGQSAIGTDQRIALLGTTLSYLYNDLGGLNRDLYKWRFSKNGANPISDFLPELFPVEGIPPPISTVNTIFAVAQFIDLSGRPVPHAKVIIALDQNPSQFGSSTPPYPTAAVGQGPTSKVFEADDNGFLQIQLVQGLQIRVAIEGTTYVRQITVPTTGTTFDLLAAMAAATDQFTIQKPLPFLIRQHI